VGIALGGLHLAVTQQFPDHFQRGPTADQQGGKGVAEIVDPNIRDLDRLLDCRPKSADFFHRLARHITGKQ
jgi:hypothetical protein